jgi:hypothetical protein
MRAPAAIDRSARLCHHGAGGGFHLPMEGFSRHCRRRADLMYRAAA